ncbi:hypothetical protein [Pyxidicoccus xibeiensis]|uniref:hypothetical protein n=1 Tax=Pyxidicoccus xibeiensis TaxID=2906759 RepID=UPI0020A75FF9|nr:hypothetical protein [Pyxidicoccus xibeiensis]MCP3139407.1 hypothetical protein [Pyxidicoccus xibeiensis]
MTDILVDDDDDGVPSERVLKKARALDRSARTTEALSDASEEATAIECREVRKVRPRVRPSLQLDHTTALFDKQHRIAYPNSNAPTPTATHGVLRYVQVHAGVYNGLGELSILQGDADVYTDPGCTVPLLDVVDNQPLGPAHPVTIANASLAGAGLDIYVLGRQRGALRLQLRLAPQADFTVDAADVQALTVVELTLDAASFESEDRPLTVRRRIVNGKYTGVPAAQCNTLRSSVTVRRPTPAGQGAPVLRLSANRVAFYTGAGLVDVNQPLADQDTELWMEGTQAGADIWVAMGLRLADGTVLENGDLLKVTPVAQPLISVGFEWENNGLDVDRRHDGRVLRPQAQWEGLSSKAKAVIALAGRFRLDTEVSSGNNPHTYGEFVIGPAYDFAQLQNQLDEIRSLMTRIDGARGRELTVNAPADIMDTTPGRHHLVWLPAGDPIVLHRAAGWGGTAQATFAAPLWLLPTFLAYVDGGAGRAAKVAAEVAAEADERVDDLVLGLIAACQYYIEIFRNRGNIVDDDGPKTALFVMFRTHFSAMYPLLATADQRNAFAHWKNNHPHRAARLLPNGYATGGGGRENQGPQIGAWLDSVVLPAGNAGRDLMSPPPGFHPHDGTQPIPYGMGLLGLDAAQNTVIAECRDLMGNVQGVNALIKKAFDASETFMLRGAPTWVRQQGGGWQ